MGTGDKYIGAHVGMVWVYVLGGPRSKQMADQTERNEMGRFEADHGIGPEDVFNEMEIHNPYTTSELAEKLGIPRRTAYKFLEELAENDRIVKKKPNPRRVIWMRGG